MDAALDEWNLEFVRVKYLRGEYEKRLLALMKKHTSLKDELAECRAEMANMANTLSFQTRETDRFREDLIEARAEIRNRELSIQDEKKSFDREKEQLQKRFVEKESDLAKGHSEAILKAVEDFKTSRACQKMIEHHVQEVRDHIFQVEVKQLARENLEDGFTRGFLKAVRLFHRKTGADTTGISISQASEDGSEALEDVDIQSVLKDISFSDDEDLFIEE